MQTITLDKFVPRPYQLKLCDALENKKYKRLLAILPRRAGKDLTCWNLMIRAALRKVGVYYYIFPTYSQAKKVIWDSRLNSGESFLDFIPKEVISATNGQEMKIKLVNGSIIQLVGSDNIDSLVGTNPCGIVYSEYALQSPSSYTFLRPILVANGGFAIFISTPRGKNHFFDLYQIAKNNPENWFCMKLTIVDTMHIPLEEIEKEKSDGLMSEDLIQQEYYTSFEMGVEGAYYTKYIDNMRLQGRITQVPWESSYRVHTAWDLGVRDSTSIIFFQTIGTSVRLIDYYENQKEGLEHYVKLLNSKPYQYGIHFAPHDIAVQEFGSGLTRLEKSEQLGLRFETISDIHGHKKSVVPNVSIMDGIECVRSTFSKMYIDSYNCHQLIKSLENYRQEYDEKRKVYKSYPLHNFASHAADAMRYLCLSLPKTADALSSRDLDQRYNEAVYGQENNLPRFFRD